MFPPPIIPRCRRRSFPHHHYAGSAEMTFHSPLPPHIISFSTAVAGHSHTTNMPGQPR